MVKKRLIANLLLYNGNVVQTRKFEPTNVVGNAFTAVDFFNSWAVDEIIILEISENNDHIDKFLKIVSELSRRCFVPLTVGGKIKNLKNVRDYTLAGADKIVVNTHGFLKPNLLKNISKNFGKQCLVCSIDVKKNKNLQSGYEVFIKNGSLPTGVDAIDWGEKAVKNGVGEFILNSLDFDGNRQGYDIELMKLFVDIFTIPVIAMGGVGEWEHMNIGLQDAHVNAVAAGNIFHYTEHSTKKAKEYLLKKGNFMRESVFFKLKTPRLPKYNQVF